MDNNYRANIAKWLALPNKKLEKWFADVLILMRTMTGHAMDIAAIMKDVEDTGECDTEV